MREPRGEPHIVSSGKTVIADSHFLVKGVVLTPSTGAVSMTLYNKATAGSINPAVHRKLVFSVPSGQGSRAFHFDTCGFSYGCIASFGGVGYGIINGSKKL